MPDEPPEAKKWNNAGRFLTDSEQKLLQGKDIEYESQGRYRIRHKTLGALHDLFTVGAKLNNEDAKKLFEGVGEITTNGTTRQTAEGERDVLPGREGEISAIIALGCRGYMENGIGPEKFLSKTVASGIQKGIADGEGIHPDRVSVDINTTITRYDDLNELAERFEQEGATALSHKEGVLLFQNDHIDSTQLTEILENDDE